MLVSTYTVRASNPLSPRRTLIGLFITVLVLSLSAYAAAAQTTTIVVKPRQQARADVLHERAAKLFDSPQHYAEAVRLLREAAALRSADDARSADELILAGTLAYYSRELTTARRLLAAGATRALAHGLLDKAANAYLDAAFTAAQHARWSEALEYTRSAERLAASPHLLPDDRAVIRDRISRIRIAGGPQRSSAGARVQ